MIKFLPLDIFGVSHKIPWKNKNAVYHLQTSALVPEIFKFEKRVKYANETTDDVIHWTQYYFQGRNQTLEQDEASFERRRRESLEGSGGILPR